jgi:hypothetical protein|tara:strand:+ start:437 stop:673 length:237 start_codon:yes stop_codon:yes gene_type:complete
MITINLLKQKIYSNMENFWTNILRYPRFFISSLVGLILVILTPLRNLFKNPKLRAIAGISIILFFALLTFILKSMTGL